MKKNITIPDIELRSILHVVKETRSGQYIIDRCPYCSKELHFYVNRKTQLFDCKKCGVTGSIYSLLKHLNKLYLLGDKTVEVDDEIKSIRQIESEETKKKDEDIKELPEKRMPVGFKIVCDKYLSSRGITKDDCNKYKIGKTKLSFKYQDYILIPIYDGGKIRGFLGRYGSKTVPEDKLRYKNSIDTDFSCLLYGYDDIIEGETKTVIITEGVFDKISCDKKLRLYEDKTVRCVCTFGKKISETQINKLLKKKVENIILSYDYDALKEIKRYGIELTKFFNSVSVAVSTNKKDIDECTVEEVLEVFDNATDIADFNLNVVGRIKR